MSLEGTQLGRYRLLRPLGSGSMGEVYLAEDPLVNRQMAIKVVRTEARPYPDSESARNAARLFAREAQAIAKLDHPNILALSDFGEQEVNGATLTYLVMPFRKEGSLAQMLRQRGNAQAGLLPTENIAQIVGEAADALQHAHDRGVIHQDVKPSNFLIRERKDTPDRPDVLLADFGIAKLTTATVTTSQSVRGTPTYMAPEQWEGHPVPASDQYALAIMAYELLTGQLPFQGRMEQLMHQHFTVTPPPPSTLNPRIPRDLDSVILHALVKNPQERFMSVAAFGRAFQLAIRTPVAPLDLPKAKPLDKPIDKPKGNDISATLTISTVEAQAGTSRALTLPGGRSVIVSVPPGAFDTQILRLEGLGEPSNLGGDPGTLLLKLAIQSTPAPMPTPDPESLKKTLPPLDSRLEPPKVSVSPPNRQSLAVSPPPSIPSKPPRLVHRQVNLIVVIVLLLIAGSIIAFLGINGQITVTNLRATQTALVRQSNAGLTPPSVPPPAYFSLSGNPQLVLSDSLNGSSIVPGWDRNTNCNFTSGNYRVTVQSTSSTITSTQQCSAESTNYGSFVLEVTMVINSGDCGGIAFGAYAPQFFLFRVCKEGKFSILRYYTTASGNLGVNVLDSNPNLPLRGPTTLAILVNGSNFKVFVNGQLADSVNSNMYSPGHIGLVAYAESNTTDVSFSNLRVWTLS